MGDFQTRSGLRGFFVQEEDTDVDADPLTSEGIFVFDGSTPVLDVHVGELVRVAGQVDEYYELTELTNVSDIIYCTSGFSPTPAYITLPVAAVADMERYEGMLVNFPQALVATENYTQGRYGEPVMALPRSLLVPTHSSAEVTSVRS